jgi:ABC-type multidrug transport system fused ATPase/permease subunit
MTDSKVGYGPETAWICNGTVRRNITLGEDMEEEEKEEKRGRERREG